MFEWDNEDEAKREGFSITSDNLAEWALKKIKEEQDEAERLCQLVDSQIADLQRKKTEIMARLQQKTGYLKGELWLYFDKVPHKETKTQSSYKLLTGSLVCKKAKKVIKHDEEKLLAWLKANGHEDFIKVTEKPMWSEYKKELEITDSGVVDETTGELPDGITVEEEPESFDIKF